MTHKSKISIMSDISAMMLIAVCILDETAKQQSDKLNIAHNKKTIKSDTLHNLSSGFSYANSQKLYAIREENFEFELPDDSVTKANSRKNIKPIRNNRPKNICLTATNRKQRHVRNKDILSRNSLS